MLSARHRASTLASRAAVVAALAVGALVLTAAPVSAHAVLESTQPVEGAVVVPPPTKVVLHFDEPVEIDLGSLRVLATDGRRVDEGDTYHPGGDTRSVAVDLQANLPNGTYVVAWRVISDDSHPVQGAFTFSVGSAAGAARAKALAGRLAAATGGGLVAGVFLAVRVGELGGLVLFVGLAVVVPVAWPRGGASRRVRRLLWGAFAVALVSTLLGVALQGVSASALPLSDLFRPALVSAVLHTRYGEVALLRSVLLLAAVPLVLLGVTAARPVRGRRWWLGAGSVVALALLATPGLAGHAAAGIDVPLGVSADIVHLLSVSLWVGGLALLAAVLVPGIPEWQRPPDVRSVALRVSALAFAAVCGVAASGVALAIRQVNSLSGLVDTTYGQLLLVKVALVAVVVALGALSRRALRGSDAAAARSSSRRIRKGVLAELILIAGVLGVTGGLVNAVPPRQLQSQPFTGTWSALGLQVNLIVEPASAGPGNSFHFYVLNAGGRPQGITELDAEISLPAQGIGPISIPLALVGPGHYQDNAVDLPFPGTWQLRITVRTTATEEKTIDATLPVR